ncbi:MAG: IS200/IS605 family transposase [Bacteroidetes bacterium]|nr:IS200/IS605 family transposase [Bacteroidota bacterium]
MSHSLGAIYVHIIFGTKHRADVLTPELHTEFTRLITPIIHGHGGRLISDGGMPDHVHLLVDLGRETSVAALLREIKARSAVWLSKRTGTQFSWQIGYGAFSVSPSSLRRVARYIERQEEHHTHQDYQQEARWMHAQAEHP